MAVRLKIKEVEERHPDLIRGQIWRGSDAKYRYVCEKHGVYIQQHNSHNSGRGCHKCGEEKCRTANRMSTTSEYKTVARHFHYIFNPDSESIKRAYKNIPFYDGWNPQRGGSYLSGAIWILANIGKRPKGTSLHIVDHQKGFIPGNLEWSYPVKQSNQKMFKIIADLKHRIKQLEAEVADFKSHA